MIHRLFARLREPSTAYLIAAVLSKVGSLFLLPLYVRRLTPADYGTYGLGLTLISLAPPVLSLGGVGAINHFYFSPETKDGLRATGTVGRWIALASLAIGLLVAAVTVMLSAPAPLIFGTRGVVYLLVAGVGSTWLSLPPLILRCQQRAYFAAIFQLAEMIFVTAFGFYFVGMRGDGVNGTFEALAAAYALGGALSCAFFVFYARGPWDLRLARQALIFSAALIPHYLAVWLQGVSDRWALKLVGDDTQLGNYNLAMQLTSPANMVVNAWNQDRSVKHGALVRHEGLDAMRKQMRRINFGYLLAAAIPAICTLAAIPLIHLFIKRSYASALWYVPGIFVAVVLDALYQPYNHVVYYANRPRWIPIATGVSAAVALGANALLVAPLGVAGAILARCITSTARLLAMAFAARTCFREVQVGPAASKTATDE